MPSTREPRFIRQPKSVHPVCVLSASQKLRGLCLKVVVREVVARKREGEMRPPLSSSFLRGSFSSRSSTSDLTRETTHVCARERVLREKKEGKEKKKGEEKGKNAAATSVDTSSSSSSSSPRREARVLCALRFKAAFCLLIGGVKGREATSSSSPSLVVVVIIDERFYSRALFAGIKDVNARHLASSRGKSADSLSLGCKFNETELPFVASRHSEIA